MFKPLLYWDTIDLLRFGEVSPAKNTNWMFVILVGKQFMELETAEVSAMLEWSSIQVCIPGYSTFFII